MTRQIQKKICILGSTGSVGRQAIEVVREQNMKLCGICADSNIDLLEEQIREFHPAFCAVRDEKAARLLKISVRDTDTEILSGENGILFLAAESGADMVENSILGSSGIRPTMAALSAGIPIAMANKEPIVAAGEIILAHSKKNHAPIIPVDSEHSAIFQCITDGCNAHCFISRLVLTASGGPFFGRKREELEKVTPEEAVKHPVWSMGQKISVDSATLLNKGLELIEAVRLFDIPADRVDITVHRQSIVHSMVSFCDGSTLAQLGYPDMRHCVHFALNFPDRVPGLCKPLDFSQKFSLTFEPADEETFTLLQTARRAVSLGGTYTTVLNAANEAAVALFLDHKIGFCDIFSIVEEEVSCHKKLSDPTIEDILALDDEVKNRVKAKFYAKA